MKKKASKKPSKMTQARLAKLLAVSPQLVNYHVKSGESPPIDDVKQWHIYLAEVGREGSLPEDLRRKIGEARARLIRAQAARAERENKLAEKELMPCASAVKQAAEAMGYTFSELERLAREIPPALAGGTAVEIGKRIAVEVERIRSTLKEKFQTIPE